MSQAINEQTQSRISRNGAGTPEVTIRALQPGEDATAFRTLNEEWITRYFVIEKQDREILGDPENKILRVGGQVFLVESNGDIVGCLALIPTGGGVYELSKMAISPQLRGLGIGRKLIEYAIEQARLMGATSLFLGSSTKLKNAIHLYESFGFRNVPPERLPPLHYERADVFMELSL